MKPTAPDNQVVSTCKAQCRDCYRCLRSCPVKAIRMHGGQAEVVEEMCIACGTCIRHCPQDAKTYRRDLERVKAMLAEGHQLTASIAPSFVAALPGWKARRLGSALRKLGFARVAETAVAAWHVAQATAKHIRQNPENNWITSACPAAVEYIERYAPELVDAIVPVASPMVAHARMLKDEWPETKVVFFGPCVAKKAEADRAEHAGLVDAVLTFEELADWLGEEKIDLRRLEESRFDQTPGPEARLFPLEGGSLRTAGIVADLTDGQVIAAGGIDEIRDALDLAGQGQTGLVIEPLFCSQGCINGPAMDSQAPTVFHRKRELTGYAKDTAIDESVELDETKTAGTFQPHRVRTEQVSEDQIRNELERTGKAAPEEQLDCGACGYGSCREKAVAVLLGMAEPEMCLPYMRRLAEQRTDRIIETSPNGIVILDGHLNILSMNPAFRKMFQCTDALLGKRISRLMDPEGFEKLAAGATERLEMPGRHERYGLLCHQILYRLGEEDQYVGIFVNITRSQADKDKLHQLRAQTVFQAQQLLDHQLEMAQQMARLLGEGTAKGEGLVDKLMELADETATAEAEQNQPAGAAGRTKATGRRKNWLWDTST
ncbi:MAG: [Fe-Fe] hydrogenase large subunit C-terminal domain-containing protein [Phycisphaerae bacterium]